MKSSFPFKITGVLSSLIALRMFGLFLMMPILAILAQDIEGATPATIGIAIGIYGLTQAIFQIPMGWLSDQKGRHRIIQLGLIIFAIGSLVGAFSTSIWGIILGRALQGAGAISASLMALVGDLTTDEQRGPAMGMIGASIGLSFLLAIVLGPAMTQWFSLGSLFFFIGVLSVLGILLLQTVPQPTNLFKDTDRLTRMADFKDLLGNRALAWGFAGVFILHAFMSAFFVRLPVRLVEEFKLDLAEHWTLYVPVFFASILLIIPLLMHARKKQAFKLSTQIAFVALIIAFALLSQNTLSWIGLYIALIAYFTGFNTLEALLPTWVSHWAPAGKRGSAMGIFASSQFLGAFAGAMIAGISHNHQALLYVGSIVLCLIASISLIRLPKLPITQLIQLSLQKYPKVTPQLLLAQPGVQEGFYTEDTARISLKIDPKITSKIVLTQWAEDYCKD
jgi:MFS family permease